MRLRNARWTWLLWLALPAIAAAHGVSSRDAGFVAGAQGVHFGPFAYLGAKHMVTGYDHLLFLAGVIFLLHRLKDVALYATLFAVGHTITLLGAVLLGYRANPFIVDAVIGLSVVYKGFENIGGFRQLGLPLDPRAAVLAFGLVHGLGLATKLQELQLSRDGLAANLIGFNVGVELGQIAVLAVLVPALNLLFRGVPERAGILILSALVLHTGWHWMTDRWSDLRKFPMPTLDAAAAAGLLRWAMAAVVLAGLVWFADRWLKRWMGREEVPRPARGQP